MGRKLHRPGIRELHCAVFAIALWAVEAYAVPDAHQQHAQPTVLAPGYTKLQYAAPQPGSYRLPSLGAAGDGLVLDADGHASPLDQLLGERVVLLSFIFTTCSEGKWLSARNICTHWGASGVCSLNPNYSTKYASSVSVLIRTTIRPV